MGKLFSKARFTTIKWTDARVKQVNEILNGASVMKVYNWEKSLEKVVLDARESEYNSISKAGRLRGINLAVFFAASCMISVATFGGMWLMNQPFTPAGLFTSLAFFNMIRTPLTNFVPLAIEKLSEARIASKRVDEFMRLSKNNTINKHDNNTISNNIPLGSIHIDNASLVWEYDTNEQGDIIPKTKLQREQSVPSQVISQQQQQLSHNSNVLSTPMNKLSDLGQHESSSITLQDITLHVEPGQLVSIIGSIGSGKSSLLSGILDEMTVLNGSVAHNGKIAYASQLAWIYSGTIRDNITFGQKFDLKRYQQTIIACCLVDDLKLFEASDLTVVGEKGVNLSGGQKARVSLARAVYSDADIYLLDDVLAAVDPKVAANIWKLCISSRTGLLRNKTRIVVTHQTHFVPSTDYTILLHNGKVLVQGKYNDLTNNALFMSTIQKDAATNDGPIELDDIETEQSHEPSNSDNTSNKQQQTTAERLANDKVILDELNQVVQLGSKADATSITVEEKSANSGIPLTVWHSLFVSGYGWFGLITMILLMLIGEACYDATNRWLSIWASSSHTAQREPFRPAVYLGLAIGTLLIAICRADFFMRLMLRGSSNLHNNMFKGVLYSSLRFYESNASGRILNRFSKDQQVIDEQLPLTAFDTTQSLVMVLGSIVIIGMSNPWVMFFLIPIVPGVYFVRRYYLATSREIKRLDSVTRSPVYALFGSSLSGLQVIRAFNVENDFVNQFLERVNTNARAYFIFLGIQRWFGLRLDLMTVLLSFATAVLSVAVRASINPAYAALGLMYCINLTSLFQWGVRQSAEAENFLTSAQRIEEYGQLEQEEGFDKPIIQTNKPISQDWPQEGKIEFINYELRYRPELQPVLRGLNVSIPAGSKVGFCGRTGAGKSSTFQAVFRLVSHDCTQGSIRIDDIDIASVPLNVLRQRLSIIPQSPIIYSNTLRYNLDPFNQYTDQAIWQALDAVQLKRMVKSLPNKLETLMAEGGNNFSVGENQLICVARAILKPSKILLVDEATASVDKHTDELIQKVIRDKFSDRTVLTIAHRLNTILDSDYIVVLQAGKVIEFGPPQELLQQQDGVFKSMNDAVQQSENQNVS